MTKSKPHVEESLIEEPGKGHNSFAKEELMKIIVEVERMLEERSNLNEDIRAAMDVAKSQGFDKRTIREMLKLRALDTEVRAEREELRDLYLSAIGLA